MIEPKPTAGLWDAAYGTSPRGTWAIENMGRPAWECEAIFNFDMAKNYEVWEKRGYLEALSNLAVACASSLAYEVCKKHAATDEDAKYVIDRVSDFVNAYLVDEPEEKK